MPARAVRPLQCIHVISLEQACFEVYERKTAVKDTRTDSPARDGLSPDARDVSYGPHPRNVLDVWRARATSPAPLVIYIHGGGFRAGDKSTIDRERLRLLLDAGFAVASINYRLSDTAREPAYMLDGARAVQFLRANAERWGIDPARVAATGNSAGGGISMWLAFHPDLADAASDDPVARESTRLSCAAVFNAQCTYDPRAFCTLGLEAAIEHVFIEPFYGMTRDEFDTPEAHRRFDEAAAITYLDASAPPVYQAFRQEDVPVPSEAEMPPVAREKVGIPKAKPRSNVAVHHPRLGKLLKERMDALGLECELRVGVEAATANPEMVAFFGRHMR